MTALGLDPMGRQMFGSVGPDPEFDRDYKSTATVDWPSSARDLNNPTFKTAIFSIHNKRSFAEQVETGRHEVGHLVQLRTDFKRWLTQNSHEFLIKPNGKWTKWEDRPLEQEADRFRAATKKRPVDDKPKKKDDDHQ